MLLFVLLLLSSPALGETFSTAPAVEITYVLKSIDEASGEIVLGRKRDMFTCKASGSIEDMLVGCHVTTTSYITPGEDAAASYDDDATYTHLKFTLSECQSK